jgi:ABC-type dipeptide/oligopeptide/nickel transport system permease subunit
LVFSISFLLAHRIVPPEERYQNNHRTLSQNITRYLPKMLSGAFLACSIAFIAYFTTSFIGFSDPTTVNWANDLFSARAHIYDAPWATIAPMTAIFLFLLSFILLALGFYHSAEESEKEL